MMGERRRFEWTVDALMTAGLVAGGLYFLHQYFSSLLADPEKEKHEQARLRAEAHLERLARGKGKHQKIAAHEDTSDENASRVLKRQRIKDLALNHYENIIALDMVSPEDISIGFNDIGGLDNIIEELQESVIYPLTMPHLYSHGGSLLSAPSGVLLYGPPGCGKTMLAKALAHESGASFINLHISTLLEKWYGDSNKLVKAVFSLARKLQPTIIFIDEIDALLRTRVNSDHEASGMVKAEFMSLWDGLTTANAAGEPARIVVLGATNRMHDIDEAILRRMPRKFAVPLPGRDQRRRILQLLLHATKIDGPNFDLEYIAKVTAGMSGSDIKEACRDAAMVPVREYMRQHKDSGGVAKGVNPDQIRGIQTGDFFGRHGGNQILMENHVAETVKGALAEQDASEVYEDVE